MSEVDVRANGDQVVGMIESAIRLGLRHVTLTTEIVPSTRWPASEFPPYIVYRVQARQIQDGAA